MIFPLSLLSTRNVPLGGGDGLSLTGDAVEVNVEPEGITRVQVEVELGICSRREVGTGEVPAISRIHFVPGTG